MPALAAIRLSPVKGLDGIDADETRVLPGGTLAHDRGFALFHAHGDVFNGKRRPGSTTSKPILPPRRVN